MDLEKTLAEQGEGPQQGNSAAMRLQAQFVYPPIRHNEIVFTITNRQTLYTEDDMMNPAKDQLYGIDDNILFPYITNDSNANNHNILYNAIGGTSNRFLHPALYTFHDMIKGRGIYFCDAQMEFTNFNTVYRTDLQQDGGITLKSFHAGPTPAMVFVESTDGQVTTMSSTDNAPSSNEAKWRFRTGLAIQQGMTLTSRNKLEFFNQRHPVDCTRGVTVKPTFVRDRKFHFGFSDFNSYVRRTSMKKDDGELVANINEINANPEFMWDNYWVLPQNGGNPGSYQDAEIGYNSKAVDHVNYEQQQNRQIEKNVLNPPKIFYFEHNQELKPMIGFTVSTSLTIKIPCERTDGGLFGTDFPSLTMGTNFQPLYGAKPMQQISPQNSSDLEGGKWWTTSSDSKMYPIRYKYYHKSRKTPYPA